MALKFLINNNEVLLGNVEFHYELLGENREASKTIGGGRFHFDRRANKCYFFGTSMDFGSVTKEQLESAMKNTTLSFHVTKSRLFFSNEISFQNAEKTGWQRIELGIY